MHDPSFSLNLFRFGCFLGTFSPSFLQILSTLLWFTLHPYSLFKRAVILLYPYLPYFAARVIMSPVSCSSSDGGSSLRRWVALFCSNTLHARLSDTPCLSRTLTISRRLLDGLRSFPPRLLSVLSYPEINQLPVSLTWRFPSPGF